MNELFDFTLPDDYGEPEALTMLMDGFFGNGRANDDHPHPMGACSGCYNLFNEDNLTTTYDGFLVCAECLAADFVTCDSCSSVVAIDDVEKGICPVCGNNTGGE